MRWALDCEISPHHENQAGPKFQLFKSADRHESERKRFEKHNEVKQIVGETQIQQATKSRVKPW